MPNRSKIIFPYGFKFDLCKTLSNVYLVHQKIDFVFEITKYFSGTKIMQVGHKNTIGTYRSEIPSIGSIRGLIDLQLCINHIESLVKKVDIRDPYAR